MKYLNKKISDVTICYIGGGSRGWAWTFMTDLAMEPALSGTIRLYDIDHEAAKHNEMIGNKISEKTEAVGKWKYETIDSLKEAVTGADFVVISILPGTFDEMQSDVHLPEKLGIYQSVGDTAGPGGLVRALRTLPMMAEFAEAIKKYAPEAWVINYTNPMSLCVKVLYHVFPQIKAFGCCHEVFGTQKVLAKVVEEEMGIEEVKREDIHINVLGINHFTWFDRASYQGIDIFPLYQDYIEKHPEGMQLGEKHWMNSTFECAHLVKFDLFKRYGLIAAAGDRHLAEFMPGERYLDCPEVVKKWKFGLTTVDWRKNELKERLEKSDRLVLGEEALKLQPSGEEGILLIKAICGLERVVSNVNIPNTYLQIPNLPAEAIVETNAVFARNSIQPIMAGKLPDKILSLVMPHVLNHELILKAAMDHDMDAALEAFLHDPLVAGRCSEEDARACLREMISNTLKYLPKEWRSLLSENDVQ